MDCEKIISNTDKDMSLVCAIIIGLTHYPDLIIEVFKNKLTKEEYSDLNFRRKKPYYYNFEKGITDDQIKQIKDAAKGTRYVLAAILYRICGIPEGEQSEEVIDKIAERIDIQIIIYDKNKKIIYKTPNKFNQIKILYYKNIYKFITREALITPYKIKKLDENYNKLIIVR